MVLSRLIVRKVLPQIPAKKLSIEQRLRQFNKSYSVTQLLCFSLIRSGLIMFQSSLVRIGVDASYDAEHIAVVVGWQADIDNLHHGICTKLGLNDIHMRDLARKAKEAVIEQVRQGWNGNNSSQENGF
jgi:hypothetical protein